MVNTRSQGRSSVPVFMSGMDKHDRSSDTESECSVPEVLSRDQIDELDDGNLIRTNNNSEQRSIDQRFSEMNEQISDLTGLVLALTEKLSSNSGEGNNQSTASDKTCARSDRDPLRTLKNFRKKVAQCRKNPKGGPFRHVRFCRFL